MNDEFADDAKLIDAAAETREQGDIRGAIRLYTQLLRKHQVSELYNERGVLYSKLRDYDAAISDLTCAIDLSNEDADCYVNRGNAYFWLGELDAALDDYNRAIELAPGSSQAYNARGNVHAHLGRRDNAERDFLDAIKLNPACGSPYHNLSQLLVKLGEPGKAMPYAVRATELLHNNAASLCLLGDLFAANGDFRGALEKYLDAARADPAFVIADLRVSSLLSTCPDKSIRDGCKAVEYARRACNKTDCGDYYGLATLVAAYVECGQYDEAARWQAGAVALAPANAVNDAKSFLAELRGKAERKQ